MPKKKHKTPARLDYLFERKLITRSQYREFWSDYWGKHGTRARDRYVDRFISELQAELQLKRSGTITTSLRAAREQAVQIGGYVVRRNAAGKFSKRGRHYQAVVRKRRTK